MLHLDFTFLTDSNFGQVALTLIFGGFFYLSSFLIVSRAANLGSVKKLFGMKNLSPLHLAVVVFLFFIFISLTGCFLLNIGETYNYSPFYKRSFGYFGDGFPVVMILFLSYGLLKQSNLIILITFLTIFLFGSKIVFVLAFFCVLVHRITLNRQNLVRTFRLAIFAFFAYFVLLFISNWVDSEEMFASKLRQIVVVAFVENQNLNEPSNRMNVTRDENNKPLSDQTVDYSHNENGKSLLGQGICRTVDKCIDSQIFLSLKLRVATSLAGLWMMQQGGFPGKLYPGNPEKFANFMMLHNPYNLNQRLGLTYLDWLKAGAVQNPYLNIGAGYGPLGFFLVVSFFLLTMFLGYRNLINSSDISNWSSFTIFFITIAMFNQTQEWIQANSDITFLAGIAIAHIWRVELSKVYR
jgi:hypothetical protein